MLSRRSFFKINGSTLVAMLAMRNNVLKVLAAPIPGSSLDPLTVQKYQTPLLIPLVMPKDGTVRLKGGKSADYSEISVRQFEEQILPAGLPATTVWDYGAVKTADPRGILLHHAPSLTIEGLANKPVCIKWINDLKDAGGAFLLHLLPVDPTLHWANLPGGMEFRDHRPDFTGKTYVLPESWETGFKDTVTAFPGEVTRIKAQFLTPGQFVWHCHIVEHEDNEMMRPYRIGPGQPGEPGM